MDSSLAVKPMKEDPAIFDDPRVIENILKLDTKNLPSANYFADVQVDVKPKMRKILLNWMLEVLEEQKCEQDVYFLAVNYVDRFLSTTCISRDDLQLVGTAAMFVACKLREPRPLAADTLVMYPDNSVELQQLMMMEIMLVSTLKWDIAAITPYDVLLQVVARLSTDKCVRARLQATAYIALTRFVSSTECLQHTPTMVAACALATAIDAVHTGAEVEADVDTDDPAACSLHDSPSGCAGCTLLGATFSDYYADADDDDDTPQCCFEELYAATMDIVCSLLHTTLDRVTESKQALRKALISDSADDEQHNEGSSAIYAQDDDSNDDAGEGEAKPAPTTILIQPEPRSIAVLNQDEDSLMSQSDVEMASLAELNNNEPNDKLLRPKSLDDSGFVADLSPSNRTFASTPTECGIVHMLAF